VVTNYGTKEHNFVIIGRGLEEGFTQPLQPGESRTLEVDLSAGPYLVSMPMDDQPERSVAGIVVVLGEDE
jgi:hypothetical protein